MLTLSQFFVCLFCFVCFQILLHLSNIRELHDAILEFFLSYIQSAGCFIQSCSFKYNLCIDYSQTYISTFSSSVNSIFIYLITYLISECLLEFSYLTYSKGTSDTPQIYPFHIISVNGNPSLPFSQNENLGVILDIFLLFSSIFNGLLNPMSSTFKIYPELDLHYCYYPSSSSHHKLPGWL